VRAGAACLRDLQAVAQANPAPTQSRPKPRSRPRGRLSAKASDADEEAALAVLELPGASAAVARALDAAHASLQPWFARRLLNSVVRSVLWEVDAEYHREGLLSPLLRDAHASPTPGTASSSSENEFPASLSPSDAVAWFTARVGGPALDRAARDCTLATLQSLCYHAPAAAARIPATERGTVQVRQPDPATATLHCLYHTISFHLIPRPPSPRSWPSPPSPSPR
jgi:hypothetical protein